MKKVVFTIASLFMLMLVGCGGDSGSVTTSNTNDSGVANDAGDAVVKSSGAYIPNGLPDIPAIPE